MSLSNPPHLTALSVRARRLLLLALACGLAAVQGAGAQTGAMPPHAPVAVPSTIDPAAARVPPEARRHGERLRAWNAMLAVYRQRGGEPVWSGPAGVRPAADELLAAIPALAADGLDLRLYPVQELGGRLAAVRADLAGPQTSDAASDPAVLARRVDLDLGLSYTFLAAGAHLAIGRIQPAETVHVGWHLKPPAVDLPAALARVAAGEHVAAVLADLAPHAEGYLALRRGLARYREIAERGGWQAIPAGPALRRGSTGPRVAALAARLAAEGDLAAPPADPSRYDETIAAAVARFRVRHGLASGDTVDAATVAVLNVPVERRIRQIEMNLERWRWMEGDLGPRYVLVDVPDFRLTVADAGRTVMTMKVIVGKAGLETPVFSDLLTQVILNPDWKIPDSIAAREISRDELRPPGYLKRKGIEVRRRSDGALVDPSALGAAGIRALGRGSPYRLRQPPGPENPLGRYKFVVPNRFDVYLHDTPAGSLFDRSARGFSHGCIRIEHPADLAAYLLGDDPRWTHEAIAAEVETGKTATIPIPRPLPVFILYLTAWEEADGTVEFRPDLYSHDAWLDRALAAEAPLWGDLAAVVASQAP